MQATVERWGQDLAVKLPAAVVAETGWAEGQSVDVVVTGGEMHIRSAAPGMDVAEMFKGRSAAQWQALYRGSYDWGADHGREIVGD